MEFEQESLKSADPAVELSRLLEIGAILASVLTPEEIENLRILMSNQQREKDSGGSIKVDMTIGNSSVT
jgi:hypothetical protein